MNLLDKSGQINIEIGNDEDNVPLGNAMQLADGNFFTRFRYGRSVRSPEDVWGKITVDLGAVTMTTAELTLTLPADSTVTLPALTSNAVTITAATAKVFVAKELTTAASITTKGGAGTSIEVKDLTTLTSC